MTDIAITQSTFQNNLGSSGVQSFIFGTIPNYCLLRHEDRWASLRKSLQNTGNSKFNLSQLIKKSHHKFLVKAVATLEPKCSVQTIDEEKRNKVLSFNAEPHEEDSEEVAEREKLRRKRISKANKGNTPWNKGRKHSPGKLLVKLCICSLPNFMILENQSDDYFDDVQKLFNVSGRGPDLLCRTLR